MRRTILMIMAWMPVVSPAASFTLGATIRVADALSAFSELQLGSTSGVSSASANMAWSDGFNHDFQLSYNGPTNVATLNATTASSLTTSVGWTVAGGSPNPASLFWTINSGKLAVTAQIDPSQHTQIRLRNLSLSGTGFATINPANLVANQNQNENENGGGTVTDGNAAPITFTTSAGGSWVLNGQIRFVGITGGSSGNSLLATLNIGATGLAPVPEPESLLLSTVGLATLGVLFHFRGRRRSGPTKAMAPVPRAGTSSKR